MSERGVWDLGLSPPRCSRPLLSGQDLAGEVMSRTLIIGERFFRQALSVHI